jgi:hypothetical protein
MSSELVFAQRASEATLTVEIDSELMNALEVEFASRKAESNPGTITFDGFLELCTVVGLERLAALPVEQALDLVLSEVDEGDA